MATETLKFGTSGLRGLASLLAGPPAFNYTVAFLRVLLARGEISAGDSVLLAHDLRSTSPEILRICASGAVAAGMRPIDCGAIPTPALALAAAKASMPAIMVSGSHIPADRNGLKFYRASGEIDKRDEADIVAAETGVGTESPLGAPLAPATDDNAARDAYIARYRDFFPPLCLSGLSVGVWQQSSVARDLLADVLAGLGARTVLLGRSDTFIAIDTEAVSDEDTEQAARWAREHGLDAIVSTDGDADRPLMFDATGAFVAGDLLGAITARALRANVVVSPVTSNSGLEGCGYFETVRRCRVGSPFVIEEMEKAGADGVVVVGFEANGGVLLGSDVLCGDRLLKALATRDSLLPLLCCLETMARDGRSVAEIAAGFGFKAKAAGRLENVPFATGASFLANVADDPHSQAEFDRMGGVATIDRSDGVRVTLRSGEVVHFRMSGNAPELRCYTEAATMSKAGELLASGFTLAQMFIDRSEAA